MTILLLRDLIEPKLLGDMLDNGFVRRQYHPDLPLAILNYTEKTQYEKAWNDITTKCRGLIYNIDTNEVIARPFEKFFNYGEHPEGTLDLDTYALVTDKMDGSLGILYWYNDEPWIATRGSFTSEQAVHATKLFRLKYWDRWQRQGGMTELFEIVYPENRIVLDYGDTDDLFHLGSVSIPWGDTFGPDYLQPTPCAFKLPAISLREALELKPRANAEGIVVHFAGSDTRVKIKQDDYVALHRIITGLNERVLWSYMAVNACKHLIKQPKHWGTHLKMNPADAQKILDQGPGWYQQFVEKTPDEFHTWLESVYANISSQVVYVNHLIKNAYELAAIAADGDRKTFATIVGKHEHAGALFLMLDGRDITPYLWLQARPESVKPFKHVSEDTA